MTASRRAARRLCVFPFSPARAARAQPPPERRRRRQVDVWAAGVVLYVMLVGVYPFGDLADTRSLIKKIAKASFSQPPHASAGCQELLARRPPLPPPSPLRQTESGWVFWGGGGGHLCGVSALRSLPAAAAPNLNLRRLPARIFVVDPAQRITVDGIRSHPWFLVDCPAALMPGPNEVPVPEPAGGLQTVAELETLCKGAAAPAGGAGGGGAPAEEGDDDLEKEFDDGFDDGR